MIVREWDPAADGHRVGRFGPGPGVRRAAVATLFGSRPRSAASPRRVARPARRARRPRGAKALLRVGDRRERQAQRPEEGLELRSGYPTPWHWEGVGAADGVPGPSPSSRNGLARASRAPPRASRGPLAGAPRSATPQGSTTPGYSAWPPSLAPARASRTRAPAGLGCRRWPRLRCPGAPPRRWSSAGSSSLGREPNTPATNLTRSGDPPSVDSPPLELRPPTPPGRSDAQEEGVPFAWSSGSRRAKPPLEGREEQRRGCRRGGSTLGRLDFDQRAVGD
jgi:hypothetical protein